MQKQQSFLALLITLTAWPGANATVAAPGFSVGAWGNQNTAPLNAQSGVMAIAAGVSHTVALRNDGSVLVWGDGRTVALKKDGSVVVWDGYQVE